MLAIRQIGYRDDLFAPLLAEAEAEGGPFLLRLRSEWLSGATRFNREGEILFGAFVEGRLVGVGGITHDPYAPVSNLGRIRHVYVLKEHRGKGIGRLLVERIVAHAHGRFTTLRLTTQRPEAARLYESFGFMRREAPRQTHWLELQLSSTSLR